jgi:methyl-accepting chemotaxis protein
MTPSSSTTGCEEALAMTTLRGKLLLGFLVPLVVFAPVAIVILLAESNARSASDDLARIEDRLRYTNGAIRASIDSETGMRGFLLTDDPAFLEPYNQGRVTFDSDIEALRVLVAGDATSSTIVQQMAAAEADWRTRTAEPAMQARRTQDLAAALAFETTGEGKAQKDRFRTLADSLLGRDEARREQLLDTQAQASDQARLAVFLGAMSVAAAAVATAFVVSRSMTRRVGRLSEAADAVRRGDLTDRVLVKGSDEIAQLAEAHNAMVDRLVDIATENDALRARLQQAVDRCRLFAAQVADGALETRLRLDDELLEKLERDLNSMVAELQQFVLEILAAAQHIATAANDTLAAVSQHTAAATEQSAAVAQVSSTADEVRAAAEQAATRAQRLAGLAADSVRVSDDGESALRELSGGMVDIRETMTALTGDILDLSEHAQQINEITAVVGDLADQSNLLALNASIEAAKAGEHGRGFGVVAAEIRSLADQSKDATIQIRSILTEIQRATNAAVLGSEHGVRAVAAGGSLTERASQVLDQLTGTVTDAHEASQIILISTQEQRIGIDQVASSLRDVDVSTAQFLSGAHQLQGAAKDLADLATRLDELTARYRSSA